MKSYISLLIIAVVLVTTACTNSDKNIRIYSNEDNIEFFEISDQQLSEEFLNSAEFTEKIYNNIEKNIGLNINYKDIIVINKPVDEIKYIPYQVYLSEGSNKVESISSYYGIADTSESKKEGKFYIEDFTTENNKETDFVNSFNQVITFSSHYPNVKIYFVRINHKYLVFSIKA